jgi:hypothetical protein
MRNRGLLYVGILLVLFGGIFLVAQLGESVSDALGLRLGWEAMWPFLVLFVGLAFLLPLLIWSERRRELVGLVMPGSIITTNGLILLFQNTMRDFSGWAYLWPLELIAVAIGLLLLYLLGNHERGLLVATGIVGGIGLVFLVVFSSAFGGGLLRFAAPLVLIGIGLFVVLMSIKGRAPQE